MRKLLLSFFWTVVIAWPVFLLLVHFATLDHPAVPCSVPGIRTLRERAPGEENTGKNINTLSLHEARQLFYRANELYERGQYTKAAELYRQIIDGGFHSAAVYFNLGSSLLRLEDYAAAAASFAAARQLNPRDPEITAALNYARSELNPAIAGGQVGPGERPTIFARFLTSHEMILLAGSLYMFLVIQLVLVQGNSRWWEWGKYTSALCAVALTALMLEYGRLVF